MCGWFYVYEIITKFHSKILLTLGAELLIFKYWWQNITVFHAVLLSGYCEWRQTASSSGILFYVLCGEREPPPDDMLLFNGAVHVHFYRPVLHGMQTRSSDASVCPSVRLSNAWIVTKLKKNLSRLLDLYHIRKVIQPSFLIKRMVSGGDPFYLKFWVNGPTLERTRGFSTDNHS